MPFFRMDTDSLRMVYVDFHKPICPRDFSQQKNLNKNVNIWPMAKNENSEKAGQSCQEVRQTTKKYPEMKRS